MASETANLIEACKAKGHGHPKDYRSKPWRFAEILNADPELRGLFRAAVAANQPTTEDGAAAGLSQLFPMG